MLCFRLQHANLLTVCYITNIIESFVANFQVFISYKLILCMWIHLIYVQSITDYFVLVYKLVGKRKFFDTITLFYVRAVRFFQNKSIGKFR